MEEVSGLAAYEGLVFKTAELFAAQVGYEREDMQQEIRIKIVKAKRVFDPTRSRMSERAYVFGCVANLVKDMKKLAARRAACMRVEHIEDHRARESGTLSHFEFLYMRVTEEDAYTLLSQFVMPSSVTDAERQMIALLVCGFDQQEIGDLLGMPRHRVTASFKGVREKLADWQPDRAPAVAEISAAEPIAA